MTHPSAFRKPGSLQSQSRSKHVLAGKIEQHQRTELVSFHTPGHKTSDRLDFYRSSPQPFDVTELPGLDELCRPQGPIAEIERQAAELWQTQSSLISVNGGSAALMAAILACRRRGSSILVPRNAHRSVVNALVLSDLAPIWYEPQWDSTWQCWSSCSPQVIARTLEVHPQAAGVICVSPTYGGTLSDMAAISAICKTKQVALIVDEAHGAHLLPDQPGMPPSAVQSGADAVIHSLHKTVSAMTQTALLHLPHGSLFTASEMRSWLNILQTSSPSYVLIASIEAAIAQLQERAASHLLELRQMLEQELASLTSSSVLTMNTISSGCDPAHMLISLQGITASSLQHQLAQRGIFAEAIIGNGLLLLLGLGNSMEDVRLLASTLKEIVHTCTGDSTQSVTGEKFLAGDQVLSPRQAMLAPSRSVCADQAQGLIAAECYAPCPPGIPLIVPGQRLSKSALEACKLDRINVVVETFDQGDQ